MTEAIQTTALTRLHIENGARMVPFAGYIMPVQYEGINIEHETVRKDVGVFDVSHMGEFLIEGENALDLIQKVTSNDASKLQIGDAQYSCLPNAEGGIVDDLIVYRIKEFTYLLVVNASNIEKDWNWISKILVKNACLLHHCQVPCFRFEGIRKRWVFPQKTFTNWRMVMKIQPLNP